MIVIARVIAVAMVLFACFAISAGFLMPRDAGQTPEQALRSAAALLYVSLLQSVVMTYIILRSRWSGWRLMLAVFVVFYGVTTVMPQIESAVFLTRLPPGIVERLFLVGALTAAPFSVLAVAVCGQARTRIDARPNDRLVMPAKHWVWKLGVISTTYVVLYFTFGYYVAWRNPAVAAYYGGTDPGSFLAQMANVTRETPWLVPLQVARALLWTALALPVVRMLKGDWAETAVVLGCLFAIVMNAPLLLPNPYMPDAVRMAHLIETASSNFIFGCVAGRLLTKGPGAARQ